MQIRTLPELAKKNFGDFLNGRTWSHWITLTTKRELTLKGARRAMVRLQDNLLKKNIHTNIFWASEPFDIKEGQHLHCVVEFIGMDKEQDNKKIYLDFVDSWRTVVLEPKARILGERYDNSKGATYYLSKYIQKKMSDYDFFGSDLTNKEITHKEPIQIPKIVNKEKALKRLREYCKINNTNLEILSNQILKNKKEIEDINLKEKEIYGYNTK